MNESELRYPIHIVLRPVRATALVGTWRLRLGGRGNAGCGGYRWSPPTDVFETDDGGVIRIEIAGMAPQDFDITYEDGRLRVSGHRSDPPAAEAEPAHRTCALKEIATGWFTVVVAIPWPVDVERAEAVYRDGFLTVRLPRNEQ